MTATSAPTSLPFDETRARSGILQSLLSSDFAHLAGPILLLVAILLVLAATPFLFSGSQP